jgi:lysophospholipase L1-like esterase
LTYVAIGASDATGYGVAAPRRDGWVPVLARRLPQPVRLLNAGVPGTTLREALETQLPRAVAAQPDLVTIWLLVNDVLAGVPISQYRTGLARLLGDLREKTDAVIAVGNAPYPPAGLDPWGLPDIARRALAQTWNAAIGGAAREHGALLVDLYSGWPLDKHPEYIGPDGLHPTVAGYRALADTFAATLHTAGVV